jgi:hypothetical protein
MTTCSSGTYIPTTQHINQMFASIQCNSGCCFYWVCFVCLFVYNHLSNFSSPELKAQVSYSDHPLSVRLSVCKLLHFLLQNHWVNFNQTWNKSSLETGIQVCSNEGQCPSLRGDNSERNMHKNIKNLLFKNQWANFNQIWYKLSLDEGNSSLFK